MWPSSSLIFRYKMCAFCIEHEITFNSIDHSLIHEEANVLQAVRAWSVTQRRVQKIYFKKSSRGIQAWILLYLEPRHEALCHNVTDVLRLRRTTEWKWAWNAVFHFNWHNLDAISRWRTHVFVDQGQFVLARLQQEQPLETSTSIINSLSLNLDDALFYVVRL